VPEERRRTRKKDKNDSSPSREVAVVRCPFCHDDVPQDVLAARCGACQTVHHASCFDEKGGCSVAGCGGKAAHVVKGWRDAFGECRACKTKVYLDENVALCKACEAAHHPGCLEARAGCAECGSGEGMLVHAGTYKKASASAARIAWWFYGFGVLLLPAAVVAAIAAKELKPGLPFLPVLAAVATAVLAFLAFGVGGRIVAAGKRRAMGLGQTQAVKPAVSGKTQATKEPEPPAPSP
jgi:hypothetical protein